MTHTTPPHTLITALLGPPGPQLTCDECFEHLDRYIDLTLTPNTNPDHTIPGMRAHLTGCPACHDDHDSLLAYTRATHHTPPPPAA
jgi:hypothetical protein